MSVRQHFRQWPPPMFLFFLLFILISCAESDELQILLNFKSSLERSNTNIFSSWTQEKSACNFSGVVCNSNGFVTEINLPQQHLVGYLPFDSICELQSLEKINLGNNSLHGKISEDLKKCARLQYLDLGQNAFSGEVPDLSSLNGLKFLNLNNSGFSGPFPWKSLENLTELTFLSLGDNPFVSSPFPLEVLKLDKLYWLYLTNCSITGQIPEGIQNLTQLQNLELSDNRLSGPIPAGIVKLNKLWQLELYNNSLSGKFPVGFGNLTSLVNFDASMNMLEGDLSELRSLKNLASLQLLENHFSGEVPEEFGEFKNLEGLSLYRNKLTGQLPPKIGSLSDLIFIDVAENFLTGPIPPDMCNNGKMVELLLLQNNFTGTIPESYANCKSLVRLRVNNNSLSGTVPAGIWSLPNLSLIDLTMNQFEGSVAGDIGNAKSLAQLFLANNRFSGELPTSISQASSLVSIQLTSNKFSGQIPATIGELKRLGSLYLNSNMFSGTISDSLGSCVSLNDVNLAGNSLSGEIPDSIGSLRNLNSLNLSENKLTGEIPATLSSSRLSLLDLSNNLLVGPIPKSLSIQVFKDSFKGNPGLCSSNLEDFQPCSSNPSTSSHLRTFLSCFIAGILVLLLSLGCYLFVRVKQSKLGHPLKQGSWAMKSYHVLSFTEKDIIDAIKSDNLIGKGGSGNVYKVELEDGKELAVKHIWTSDAGDRKSYQSSAAMLTKRNFRSLEYEAEVATLSAIRHVNVVKLYSSITSEDSSLLVYEYLPNGSLWDRLHSCHKMELSWELRYAIAVGAARGLEYLHHGCGRPVIHRDVKSSNILLDEEWKPRIADFGLAKIVQIGGGGDWTHVIAGTHGYMAPEYAYTCKINEKSDVYSFGVVLMELVTGKRPVEPEFGENKDIVYWIYNKLKSKENLVEVVDLNISEALKEDAIKVLRISVHCTAKIPALRPSMRTVVQMLEEAEPSKLTDIIVHKKGECSPTGECKNTGRVGYKTETQLSDIMESGKEIQELNRNLYPAIEPYSTGFLKVSDVHTIYWEQSGNPNGHPAVFLHGGPGGGTAPSNRRFFDPEFYRIILFDQRGAGKSTPHACLEENTTWDLIDDVEKLREHLEIPEWQVFGGSWGSTLALAYSQLHPDKVTGLVLRGIFLLRKKEIDWFYEGGAAAIYPDAWEPFRDLIPENERESFVTAYHKRLNSDDLEIQYAAARAWTKWEMMTAHLLPNEENIKRGDDDNFSLAFARIENHYFVNKGFFPSDSFLLDNVDKIRHINTTIVQGRYDVCCPMMSAWDLHKAFPEADLKVVSDAGHSANEPGIAAELVAANEKLKNLAKKIEP